ncbi:putative reverse transcriptase domain-containing protein [Tanacetum coccineum]
MLTTRGNGKVTMAEDLASNKTKDIKWVEHTLAGQPTTKGMLELYPTATSASYTISGHALSNVKAAVTCYKCGKKRHYRDECSKLKDQNVGNQKGKGRKISQGP